MKHEEHDIQAAAMEILGLIPEFEWVFAIPNGGARDKRTGARLKAEGVKPGVWDLFFPRNKYQYATEDGRSLISIGIFIEVKTKSGKLTYDQARFGLYANGQDYGIAICRSAKSIVDTIIKYSNGRFEGNSSALEECRKRIMRGK